jgi:hypothetical protein
VKMLAAYELVIAEGGAKLPIPKIEGDIPATHTSENLPRVIAPGSRASTTSR